jgi:hypothetical protein
MRIGSTVELFPMHCQMPRTSTADHALHAAIELTTALQNPAPASPLAPLGLLQIQALQQLAAIFARTLPATDKPPPRVSTPRGQHMGG